MAQLKAKKQLATGLVLALVFGGLPFAIIGFFTVAYSDSASTAADIGLLMIPVGIAAFIVGIVSLSRTAKMLGHFEGRALAKIVNAPQPATSVAAEIASLDRLHTSGVLSDSEYATAKAKVLSV